MQRGLALSSLLLATTLHAQDETYRHAYLSHIEGEVSLQRASEPEPESGSLNVPILPGDRIWTRASSRAEIRFGSGLVVHLSEGAKLDFVANDSETILRLWSGSAILAIPDVAEASGSLRVDSPAGSIRPTREGSYRIDVEDGDAVTLSVERGSAELASSLGTVLVQSGETSFATPSDPPSIPVKFNTARLDDFDRWSESREARRARTEDLVVRSLPHPVRSYAYDLSDHGDWYQEPDYGYVWYPRVSVGWAPYTYGRWGYMHWGHTWISSEPWGWAPYHYGRWGFGHRGWYWIPGAIWGPAWVSFGIGPTWVAWSPLGYHNGPVFAFNPYYGGYGSGYYWRGWNVCSRDDFRSGVVTRAGYRRLEPESLSTSVENTRFVDEVSSLDRDLNPRAARHRGQARRSSAEAAGLRPSRFGEASPPSPARRRSEDALRGFRERAAPSPPRVIDDTPRTPSRRGERPSEISDIVRRDRELESRLDSRERPARESVESPQRAPRAQTAQTGRRERVMPILPARETPSTGLSRSSRGGSESREPRGTRSLKPQMRAPEARSESRSRVERAEPRRMSGGERSSRERSSSVGRPSSGGPGGGGDAAQRTRGSQTSRGNQGNHANQGRSARSRSNQG